VGADRVARDEHPLEDGVGVALHDRGVHERPRVALVAVADEVLLVARAGARELPLHPGGKAGPAAAADAGVGDLGDHRLGGHRGERPLRRRVAAAGAGLGEVLGVDDADVAQGDARLGAVEADLVPVGDGGAGGRVLVDEPRHGDAAGEVLADDGRHLLGAELDVEGGVGGDGEGGLGAEAVAAALADLDLVLEAGRADLGHEGVVDGERAGEDAGRAGADRDPQAAVAEGSDADVAGGVRALVAGDGRARGGVLAHRRLTPSAPRPGP